MLLPRILMLLIGQLKCTVSCIEVGGGIRPCLFGCFVQPLFLIPPPPLLTFALTTTLASSDPTKLHLNPPELKFEHGGTNKEHACRLGGSHGLGDADYKMLDEISIYNGEFHPSTKLMCTIYTYDKQHEKVMPALRETWAKRCDGFMASSTLTDESLSTVNIPHKGPEEYNNIWQKVKSTWQYLHDNYIDEFEWFFIGGDDVYMLVENMKMYLGSEEIRALTEDGTKPVYLGRRFFRDGLEERQFNAGGPGYLLNRAGLKTLVGTFDHCGVDLKGFWEDVQVAKCLKGEGILPYDTRDKEGRERFLPFLAGHHYTYMAPKKNPLSDWYVKYSIGLKEGFDCCSQSSITFHYVRPKMMYRYDALLYNLC